MAFFNKTDPAEKHQRDLEHKLKAARANRDDLVRRRDLAETAAATHREKAVQLATDGADDKTLSAAENAMRRELDRAATFIDALGKIEITIANLDRDIAQVVDQRCRAETAAAVNALVEKWATARTAFDAAMSQLVDVARESAVIVIDALPLKTFVDAVQQQVGPEIDFVAGVLEGHAKAVLAGTAPASLPTQPEAAPVVVVEPPTPTRPLFCMKSIKWRDADGRQRAVMQYEDVELPIPLADRALRIGACVSVTDTRRKALKGARGGQHPNVNAIDMVDLDEVTDNSGALHQSFDPVAQANITPFDRGPRSRARSRCSAFRRTRNVQGTARLGAPPHHDTDRWLVYRS
jgi:hypothetical protein